MLRRSHWVRPDVVHDPRFARNFLQRVSSYLRRWAGKKYRRLLSFTRFKRWWTGLIERQPGLFAQWKWASILGTH